MKKETYKRSVLKITRFGEDSICTDLPIVASGVVGDGSGGITHDDVWSPTGAMSGQRESGQF